MQGRTQRHFYYIRIYRSIPKDRKHVMILEIGNQEFEAKGNPLTPKNVPCIINLISVGHLRTEK